MGLLEKLKAPWPAHYSNKNRFEIIEIQNLKKEASKEIERLTALIDEHNAGLVCDKKRCGYDGYKRDCPDCPLQWRIDYV